MSFDEGFVVGLVIGRKKFGGDVADDTIKEKEEDYDSDTGIEIDISTGTRGTSTTGTNYNVSGSGIWLTSSGTYNEVEGTYYVHIYVDGTTETIDTGQPDFRIRNGQCRCDIVDSSSGTVLYSNTYWIDNFFGYSGTDFVAISGTTTVTTVKMTIFKDNVEYTQKRVWEGKDGDVKTDYSINSRSFIGSVGTLMSNATKSSNVQPSLL